MFILCKLFDIQCNHGYIYRKLINLWINCMKTQHLHDVWTSPDNSRLVSKQFSFRLPVHIAAKIAALGELYPQKNRTQIVADLLSAALDDLEKNLPQALGQPMNEQDEHYERLAAEQHGFKHELSFMLGGARGRFRDCANKHYKELEKELGNETAEPLYPVLYISESNIKDK